MGHRQGAGREERRQRELQTSGLYKVSGAAKQQGLAIDNNPQRHADAEPEIFLQPGGSGETFRGVNDPGKPFRRA